MNIYIGSDYGGNPISVLLSVSREKAEIAWAGMGEHPHSVEEMDLSDDSLGIHGVVLLLTSTERNCRDYGYSSGGRPFREWKRGV